MSDTVLARLQRWYADQCDGDWEHEFGVTIDTLDNPGWTVAIDLTGTSAEPAAFERIEVRQTEDVWHVCWVEGKQFRGVGDPAALETVLRVFLEWVNG